MYDNDVEETLERECNMEYKVYTSKELSDVLSKVTFAPSCIDFGWGFEIEELKDHSTGALRGWFINTTFRRPDTHTGILATGRGRKEVVFVGTTDSGIVKTAWLLCELIVRHELMEAFLYKGYRPFDPHMDELTACQVVKRAPIVKS